MPEDMKFKHEKGAPVDGKTDYDRLKRMTEKEIEENAESDPDAPLLSDEELKRFKRVMPKKDKRNGK